MSAAELERLYRSHGDLVLRRARTLLGSDPEAEEVLHDVFVGLLDDPRQFAGRSAFTTWLYSATTHRCLNLLRNRRRRAQLLAAEAPVSEAVPGSAEALATARQLLAALPDELAQVAVYYFFDEMTHDEIAAILGCSRRQVGKLVERIEESSRKRARLA